MKILHRIVCIKTPCRHFIYFLKLFEKRRNPLIFGLKRVLRKIKVSHFKQNPCVLSNNIVSNFSPTNNFQRENWEADLVRLCLVKIILLSGGRDWICCRREQQDSGGLPKVFWPRDLCRGHRRGLQDYHGHPSEISKWISMGPSQLGLFVILTKCYPS